MREISNYTIFFLTVFIGAGIRSLNGQQSINKALCRCIDQTKCTLAANLVPERTSCGEGKICCPLPQSSRSTAFAEANEVALDKCYQYAGYRYVNTTSPPLIPRDRLRTRSKLKCVNVETLIVGGTLAKQMEFPHLALLGYDEDVTLARTWRCGGTLISEQFILSAAHCTETDLGKQVKWAMLGLLSKKEITEESIGRNIFRIVERLNHFLYRGEKYNDIALYKLENPIKLNPLIRPICIHQHSEMANNDRVYIAGWGKIFAGSIESDKLQKAVIKNLDPKECAVTYKESGFNSGTMICGGLPNNETNTCDGDSGGPMQISMPHMKCMAIQVGITSRGSDYCEGGTPAIYTRISAYLPWIIRTVWPQT